MIKYVLVDLDDTIFNFRLAEKTAVDDALKRSGVQTSEKMLSRYSEINLSQWKLHELGKLTKPQVKTERFRILSDEFGLSLNPEKTTALYESILGTKGFLLDGAEDFLKTLKKKFSVYAVSNGGVRTQHNRLTASGVKDYFDGVFLSEEIGSPKPNKDFFDFVARSISNFNAEYAVLVGDSLSSDVKGGITANIKTIWFNPENAENLSPYKPNFTVRSLKEAEKIIFSL